MLIKYKLGDLAKDLGLSNKDVIAAMGSFGADKKHTTVLTEEELNFAESAQVCHNRIRALSPAPMCRAYMPSGSLLKIAKTYVASEKTDAAPGTVICADKCLHIACGGGTVLGVSELVPEGKQKMAAADYLRGRKLFCGDILRGKKE